MHVMAHPVAERHTTASHKPLGSTTGARFQFPNSKIECHCLPIYVPFQLEKKAFLDFPNVSYTGLMQSVHRGSSSSVEHDLAKPRIPLAHAD